MRILFFLFISLYTLLNWAQNNSPTVNPDGSVTFHLHSPKTRKVILNGSFIPRKNNILFLNIFTSENK
ncbi:MAG: hypothetical protein K6E54_05820, partial [Bacteroidaceae bacterium]|nr:hypothetical protein [Bacteroidaceae bacterium]